MRAAVAPAAQRPLAPDWIAEGTDPPPHVPARAFEAALRGYLAGSSLQMGALAQELGMSRATLYRHVPAREALLGEVIWHLTRRLFSHALERTAGMEGRERVVAAVAVFVRTVHADDALHCFLGREPECALRVLTSAQGIVQPGIVRFFASLVGDDELAYRFVRLAEGFLYSDVIADEPPEIERALEVLAALVPDESTS